MGRHGGGSSSGGSHSSHSSSSHSSRSSSSSSSYRSSSRPFRGSYNRSWYDRRGGYHSYYTDNVNYGVASGASKVVRIVVAIFISLHAFGMFSQILPSAVHFGKKVDGVESRISIEDNMDLMTPTEEEKVLKLFKKVYDKSGMPITLVTDDFNYMYVSDAIEVHSEKLYYERGLDEGSMLIFFASNPQDSSIWAYDMYCGDNTVDCMTDATFDKLIYQFQKGMYNGGLYDAIEYSIDSVYDELATTTFDKEVLFVCGGMVIFYSLFFVGFVFSGRNKRGAERYFKEHPEAVTYTTYDENGYPMNPTGQEQEQQQYDMWNGNTYNQ